ncbi:MAG: ferrous iron transport protein B [Planctomycetota bacterium]|nr:ferrous iron transport protein B [Planctomycetota bacterium]
MHEITAPLKSFRIALLGNPNTGKTTLFNVLTGLNHRVGNYPGVTVEIKKGSFVHQSNAIEILDIPGTYSLAPRSPDELLSVELVLGLNPLEKVPDALLVIADASNLERNLYLATQAFETGLPVILALSMVDLATASGVKIDFKALSEKLGIPVIAIHASKRKGLDELKNAIVSLQTEKRMPPVPVFSQDVISNRAKILGLLGDKGSLFLAGRLLFETDGFLAQQLERKLSLSLTPAILESREALKSLGINLVSIEAKSRYAWIREMVQPCVSKPESKVTGFTDRVDRILTHKVFGMFFFFLIMFSMFTGLFVLAKPLMEWIGEAKNLVGQGLESVLPDGMLRSLLVDGLLEGVGGVVVFLPQIVILFGFLSVLEDCGYMARAAFLMDRVMAKCGLSGKSFIPLLSSVACAVPGVLATRVIEDKRDRLATILVAPLMSCSARLPVYVLFIGAFLTEGYGWWFPGLVLFLMYGIGFVTAPLAAMLFKSTILKGKGAPFLMELPVYKTPSFSVVFARIYEASFSFLKRAGTLIAATMVLIWAVLYFPYVSSTGENYPERIAATENKEQQDALLLEWKKNSYLGRAGRSIEPMVKPLGWDWRIGVATLASFPAREVVVGTLSIVFGLGKDAQDEQQLLEILQKARWNDDPDQPLLFNVPSALSLMVFFALCCQCGSTLMVIRQETGTWFWPAFTFIYMTGLAYIAALLTFQVGMLFL